MPTEMLEDTKMQTRSEGFSDSQHLAPWKAPLTLPPTKKVRKSVPCKQTTQMKSQKQMWSDHPQEAQSS